MMPQELEQAYADIQKADETLCNLCKDPSSFIMRIPADEKRDTDLLLSKGLDWADKFHKKYLSTSAKLQSTIVALDEISKLLICPSSVDITDAAYLVGKALAELKQQP